MDLLTQKLGDIAVDGKVSAVAAMLDEPGGEEEKDE
jgi:hypothetical protein